MKVLLSPHDDDAAFSLGSALIDGRLAPCVVVAIFTESNCVEGESTLSTAEITARRRKDNQMFFERWSPASLLVDLQCQDAPLRKNIHVDRVFDDRMDPDQAGEIKRLANAVRSVASPIELIIAPLGLGGHIDHVLVSKTALALGKLGWPIIYYEDLPYAARMSSQDIEEFVAAKAAASGKALQPCSLVANHRPTQKKAALKTYRTQISPKILDEILTYGLGVGDGRIGERLWGCEEALQRLAQRADDAARAFHV